MLIGVNNRPDISKELKFLAYSGSHLKMTNNIKKSPVHFNGLLLLAPKLIRDRPQKISDRLRSLKT